MDQSQPAGTRKRRASPASLSCQPFPERRTVTEQLVAHVLRPLGGLMPLEWHTEWEELQP